MRFYLLSRFLLQKGDLDTSIVPVLHILRETQVSKPHAFAARGHCWPGVLTIAELMKSMIWL
jgi:hypothetical protein